MNLDKFIAITPFHHRPDISEIFWVNANDIGLRVIACCSYGDEANIKLAECHAFKSVYNDNITGKKWQQGVMESQKHDWEYMVIIGSDDLISLEYFKRANQLLSKGSMYVGTRDAMAIDMHTKLCRIWGGYEQGFWRYGESCGAGRIISRSLVKKLEYNMFPPTMRNMDRPFHEAIMKLGVNHDLILGGSDPLRVGMKSQTTLTKHLPNAEFKHKIKFDKYYSPEVVKMINDYGK